MESKALSFEQLSDVFGFRIIVDTEDDCYRALGVVHRKWNTVPGRFKDYISTPKQNDYRSIHTTIVGPSKQRVELQIRTREMHNVAEYGVAAHAIYKDKSVEGKANGHDDADFAMSKDSNAYAWLRHTIESLSEGDNPEEFLENTKLELFQDQVFCFTPKGPADRAAARRDAGRFRLCGSYRHRQFLRRRQDQRPHHAAGDPAAERRRGGDRALQRADAAGGLGACRRHRQGAFGDPARLSRESLKPVLHRLGHKEVEDALAAVGRGELGSDDVFQALFPNHQETRVSTRKPVDEGWFNLRSAAGLIFKLPGLSKSQRASKASRMAGLGKETDAMPIRGMDDNSVVRFGPGGAVPGDRIVGILEPGAGITIYPIQSPGLTKFDDQPNRWIDIRWDIDENNKNRFPSRILVTAINAPGTLADVAQVIAASESNIQNLSMVRVAADFTEMLVDLQVWDLKHLNQLIAQLKALDSVSTVERIYE
jgi:guanosine-3',5'-bis(diphosphate) 3'-pyrophosphohydrolase